MESPSQYCVLWNNYHSYLADTMHKLQKGGQLVDVTLVTSDGVSMSAHQVVLAACSSFFRTFIQQNSSKHPFILLPSDIGYHELKAMIEFMYTGQVCIQQDRLQDFINGARYFRIKGLEDSTEESENEDLLKSTEKSVQNSKYIFSKKRKIRFGEESAVEDEQKNIPTTTIRGKTVRDHRYTQQVELGDSDDNRDKWEMVDRKPIIFPHSKDSTGNRKRRRKLSALSKVPLQLSSNVVCYERKKRLENVDGSHEVKEEPINKVRRPGYLRDDELDICTCSAKKIWSVKDTEALLKAWMGTLNQVPPSYFIRSVSLCRRVSKNLQQIGVQKNWRQCQVKMKNLRREVRLYKESVGKSSSGRGSEVANACEKLLTTIEDIFNKEEAIRREWYQRKGHHLRHEDGISNGAVVGSNDILAQVAVLADSDLADDDTDVPYIETEGEGDGGEGGEGFTTEEVEDPIEAYVSDDQDVPRHQMHAGADGTVVHHIVEAITQHPISKERE